MNNKLRMLLLLPCLVICAGTIFVNKYIVQIPQPVVVTLTAVAAIFLLAAVLTSRKN